MDLVASVPTGTFTFLFSDIEGSTRLWEQNPAVMPRALTRHDALLHEAITTHHGRVFKTMGDEFCAAFTTAPEAVAAAIAAQLALQAEVWPDFGTLRVRMAVHTGTAEIRDGDYFGPALNRVARLLAAGHGGQVLLSLAAQELVRDHLPDGVSLRDMGDRRLKDLIRPERVYQLLHPELPQEFSPLSTLDLRPNNLPAQATPLLGREKETATVRDLLRQRDLRLLTLTGTGGTGKTRLSLQVAADLIDQFEDGVYFVSLAPLTDPGLVASAIAQTLDVEAGSRPLLESLKDFLREKQVLLVLDNFEQLLPAAPLVGELLAAAPRLKALVTSRASLHLRGEHEFPVPPLPLPGLRPLPPVERLSQYAAVELFIQRAAAVKPGFAVTSENAPAVAEICHRLDGLPLAVELAAARIKLLSPQALLSRLESRLKLLTSGPQDLPARQQTLRGAIAWSYNLLDQAEQRLFQRLSVFAGGCTLEAAESACGPEGDLDVFEGIGSLVDKSLLRQEELDPGTPGGEPRFVMLETIREYAAECLAASGEAERVRRQHAEFFLELAEATEPKLHGPEQPACLDKLEREHDNFRSALTWGLTIDDGPLALRLAGALYWFWNLRNHLDEGRAWLEKALARPSAAERSPARARALQGVGQLSFYQGDNAAARSLLEESRSIWRELGDERGYAGSLLYLGAAVGQLGDVETCLALHEEALTRWRAIGEPWGLAMALWTHGTAHLFRGERQTGRASLEESVAIFRQVGDRWGLGGPLFYLGCAAREQGDLLVARAHFEEAVELGREVGEKWRIGYFLGALADIAAAEGDTERAGAIYQECLALHQERGAKWDIAHVSLRLGHVVHSAGDLGLARSSYRESLILFRELSDAGGTAASLEGIASLAAAESRSEHAVRLLGAARGLRDAQNAFDPSTPDAHLEQALTTLHGDLAEPVFAEAWNHGQAMPLEDAISIALEEGA